MFKGIIGIDWSGAGNDMKTNNGLAVACWSDAEGEIDIQGPTPKTAYNRKHWRRSELLNWLHDQIAPEQPRTLVLLDFPFSFPYGTAAAWGAGKSWQDLVRFVARKFQATDSAQEARAVAKALNRAGLGANQDSAFRFKDRCSTRWYLRHGVSYYRVTELAVSGALSEFYAGNGAQVALGALSGQRCLAHLFRDREKGDVAFEAWPFETHHGDGSQHVLAETYPALFKAGDIHESEHQRDARRVVLAVQKALAKGTLRDWFQVPEVPFGRRVDISFEEQIKLEGWIFGIFR